MLTEPELRAVIRTMWHRGVVECVTHGERLWRVRAEGPGALVAKWVPAHRRTRVAVGLTVARYLAGTGLETGAPVPAVDGSLCVPVRDGVLVLLREAPGRPLVATDPVDQQFWGDLLGTVHRALIRYAGPPPPRLPALDATGEHLDLLPELRPAVADAAAALVRLTVCDQLSYGLLHGDPDPAAFRVDRTTGRTGLVGWGWVATGLLLHDIAAAVDHLGGPADAAEFLDGYVAAGPVPRTELEVGLPVAVRWRRARRADALARRLHAGTSPDPAADRAALDALVDAVSRATAG